MFYLAFSILNNVTLVYTLNIYIYSGLLIKVTINLRIEITSFSADFI